MMKKSEFLIYTRQARAFKEPKRKTMQIFDEYQRVLLPGGMVVIDDHSMTWLKGLWGDNFSMPGFKSPIEYPDQAVFVLHKE